MAGKKKRDCNLNPEKQWGGKRENGGFPAKWRSGSSKPIRIPESLHEAVLTYAHALDENQPLPPVNSNEPHPSQGILQPGVEGQAVSPEDMRQMQLTLEAVRATVGQWREELKHHNPDSPRWKKTNQLLEALEAHLYTPWL